MTKNEIILLCGCIIACFTMAYLGNKYTELASTTNQFQIVISGQESVIASYKESLTECLKEGSVQALNLSTQDE